MRESDNDHALPAIIQRRLRAAQKYVRETSEMIRVLDLFFVALILLGCGPTIPKWLESGTTPEDPRFVYGKGSSKESYNAAESDARADIALAIEAELKVELTQEKQSKLISGNEAIQEDFKKRIRTLSQLTLPNLSIKDRYYDKKTKTYWALAKIPKIALQRKIAEELERNKQTVLSHYQAGLAHQNSGDIRLALREFSSAHDSLDLLNRRYIKVDLDNDGTTEDLETTVRSSLQSLLNDLQITVKPLFARLYLGSSAQFDFQINCTLRSGGQEAVNFQGIKLKCKIEPAVCDFDNFVILDSNGKGQLAINRCSEANKNAELQLELDMFSIIDMKGDASYPQNMPKAPRYIREISIEQPTIESRFRLTKLPTELNAISVSILDNKFKKIGFILAQLDIIQEQQQNVGSDFIAANVISLIKPPYIGKHGITFARLSWKFGLIESRRSQIIFSKTFEVTQGGSNARQAFRQCIEQLVEKIGSSVKNEIF